MNVAPYRIRTWWWWRVRRRRAAASAWSFRPDGRASRRGCREVKQHMNISPYRNLVVATSSSPSSCICVHFLSGRSRRHRSGPAVGNWLVRLQPQRSSRRAYLNSSLQLLPISFTGVNSAG